VVRAFFFDDEVRCGLTGFPGATVVVALDAIPGGPPSGLTPSSP
jgi:hypothetical protein